MQQEKQKSMKRNYDYISSIYPTLQCNFCLKNKNCTMLKCESCPDVIICETCNKENRNIFHDQSHAIQVLNDECC